jgi:K+-transporting ATPase ATPase B chain
MNVSALRIERPMNLLSGPIVSAAIRDSFVKLNPRVQLRNPVMLVVYVGSIFTTLIGVAAAAGMIKDAGHPAFVFAIAVWLWLTVLFANFAEAVAEGRGKAQAATLRAMRQHVQAKRLFGRESREHQSVESSALRLGDLVLVEANDIIPADGEVVEGVASVNESAVTGESAPVLREAGGDFSSVTGGTRVLSDWLIVRVTSREGEGFLDRMIAMVEGAKRSRTPNEIALSILLAFMTIVFLLATATLAPFSQYAVAAAGRVRRHAYRAGRATRVPHPDDHRRAAFSDWHRRDGPHGSRERHRHVGSRSRGRGRCGRSVARQDGHDHAG